MYKGEYSCLLISVPMECVMRLPINDRYQFSS